MNERTEELRAFYREHRIADQVRFYTDRRALSDHAAGQAMALTAVLLGAATAAGALGGTEVGPPWLWPLLATVLPAAAATVTAYSTLFAFEQQSKIYADAIRAVNAAARPDPDTSPPARQPEQEAAEWVRRSEGALRREQAQWGQLTAQIAMPDDTRT